MIKSYGGVMALEGVMVEYLFRERSDGCRRINDGLRGISGFRGSSTGSGGGVAFLEGRSGNLG